MPLSDPGMTLFEWKNSFVLDNDEEKDVFVKYCNQLVGDARFQRLMNAMEAAAMYNWSISSDTESRELAWQEYQTIRKFRGLILATISDLIVRNTQVVDD